MSWGLGAAAPRTKRRALLKYPTARLEKVNSWRPTDFLAELMEVDKISKRGDIHIVRNGLLVSAR